MSGQPPRRHAERLQFVLQHIEDHLGEHLDVSSLATIAGISPFHFHRMFSGSIGETVSAYVRRLRLEKGLRLLLLERISITEAAVRSGYATAAGFARAFRRHFGRNPTDMVRELLLRRAAGRQERVLMPRGLEYRELPVMRLLGVQKSGPYAVARREAWQSLDRALAAAGASARAFAQVGIPLDWSEITPEPKRRYQACVVSNMEPGAGVFRRQSEGGTYAVFRYEGTCDRLQNAHEAVLRQWSPPAGVRLKDGHSLHRYLDPVSPSERPVPMRAEIWIPVRREPIHRVAA